MTKIAFIGAGSVEFTKNLLGDILSFEELRDAHIALHDIDSERLAVAEAMASTPTASCTAALVSPPTSIAGRRSRAAIT